MTNSWVTCPEKHKDKGAFFLLHVEGKGPGVSHVSISITASQVDTNILIFHKRESVKAMRGEGSGSRSNNTLVSGRVQT